MVNVSFGIETASDAEPDTTPLPFTVTVAPTPATVGVTLSDDVVYGTSALYSVFAGANVSESAPAESERLARFAFELPAVRVTLMV